MDLACSIGRLTLALGDTGLFGAIERTKEGNGKGNRQNGMKLVIST
jgi:hypothetical protein